MALASSYVADTTCGVSERNDVSSHVIVIVEESDVMGIDLAGAGYHEMKILPNMVVLFGIVLLHTWE